MPLHANGNPAEDNRTEVGRRIKELVFGSDRLDIKREVGGIA